MLDMPPLRPPVARLADAVASALEKRILEGSLKPGDRLPAERDLAVELGVSRPSLREAIQRLAAKGLLTTRHGGGTVVTDRLEAQFAEPWQQMLAGHPLLQRDLLEFRQMLESQAAALAAERATDVDIASLDEAHATLEANYEADQLDACIDADVAFHQVVAEASHNVMIGQLAASLMRVIHGHISRNLAHLHARPARWNELRAQHRAIWLAIRERRPEDAAAAARGHIEFVRQSMDDHARSDARRSVALRRQGQPVA
jgi:GntR family transcriptional repressor for pyruvate dehydrogenase complex